MTGGHAGTWAPFAEHFRQAYGLRVSHMAVYRWLVHYSGLAAEWLDAQGLAVGKQWHVDETVVFVDGEPRYLWNVLDGETRMLLATHIISRTRTIDHTRAPLRKAKAATPCRPEEVLTDGMQAYPFTVSKEFGRMGGRTGYTNPHRRVPSIRAKDSNNRIERLHGSEKDRVKVMRGFDADGGAAAIMEGWRVHYDVVRKHLSLGKTPAEAAGLDLPDGFRWKAILERAVTRTVTAEASGQTEANHPIRLQNRGSTKSLPLRFLRTPMTLYRGSFVMVTVLLLTGIALTTPVAHAAAVTVNVEALPNNVLRFSPAIITVEPGDVVTIVFVNNDNIVHTFDIDEFNVHTGDVDPGASTTVSFTVNRQGTFSFYCAVPGHREGGMVGQLNVGAASPAFDVTLIAVIAIIVVVIAVAAVVVLRRGKKRAAP